MILHTPLKTGRRITVLLIGVCGAGVLALQGCATFGGMPEPKYPIYMQDKPAQADPAAAAESADSQPADTTPAVTAPQSHGEIATADLPPPPPPPPPAETRPAAAAPGPVKAAATATAPVKDTGAAFVYILQAHDTLFGVSRRFSVPIRQIYDINALTVDSSMRIGQRILLPASAVDKGAEEHCNGAGMTRLATATVATVAPPKPTPAKPEPVKPAVTPPTPTKPATTTVAMATSSKPVVSAPSAPAENVQPAPPPAKPVQTAPSVASNGAFPSNSQLSQMGRGMFAWPVKGKIIVPFGQLAPNVRNDGINISAGAGSDVVAAADGVVVYEGDQVKALGNTIYVKHNGGWYTGYSHLAVMSVKNNEKVTKGEVIGTVGQTGVIDRPQLHFEIRYTPSTDIAKPVDPNLVLP